jgi:general stress protein 26
MNKEISDLERLGNLIKDIKFTMLSTVCEDGTIHSRPMATQKLDVKKFDGTLWFFSRKNSIKNHEIENDQHVNLAYASPDSQKYASVCGRALITSDKAKIKELWNPTLKAWFPEGVDDPEISLIGVQVESAELWDSPPSKVVQLAGFMKASITGKPFDQNLNSQHIELQNRH